MAVGVNYVGKLNFPERVFLWCANATWKFSALPAANANLAGIFAQFATYFLGEHERILVDTSGYSSYVHLVGECAPSKPVTELDRLSHTVASIDKTCQIFPLGAYKKNTLGEVKRNEAYKGLSVAQNFDLANYALFRPVAQTEKTS